jgi:hypothetical protein
VTFVGVVIDDVATGFVVLQLNVVLQIFPPEAIVQSEAVTEPDIGGLFSEQASLAPPFEPLQVHVQVDEPLTLFVLVPVLQL